MWLSHRLRTGGGVSSSHQLLANYCRVCASWLNKAPGLISALFCSDCQRLVVFDYFVLLLNCAILKIMSGAYFH